MVNSNGTRAKGAVKGNLRGVGYSEVVRALRRDVTILGGRFPIVAIGLAGTVLLASIVGAATWRSGVTAVLGYGVLDPSAVWAGQLWRLFSWGFFQFDPLSLIFGVLLLALIGRDLAYAWGPNRFLLAALGLLGGSAAATCLLARFSSLGLWDKTHAGVWPLADAFIIAWAALFPARQMLVYFVIPVGGRNLIVLTVAGTLVFAFLDGFASFVPHFAAESLMLAWIYDFTPRRWWLQLRARSVRWAPRKRTSHLRPVDRDEPPRWLH